MTRPVEPLQMGWSPAPFVAAAVCALLLLATAVAIHAAGLAGGACVLVLGFTIAMAAWCEASIDGPAIRLRGPRSFGRTITVHARDIDRIEYRRGRLAPRLALVRRGGERVLRATGPSPAADGFRQAAMWLLVHGRRQARIDAALLDALAAMPDHAREDQPHDASHA